MNPDREFEVELGPLWTWMPDKALYWELVTDDADRRPCRQTSGQPGRKACGRPSVARMDRSLNLGYRRWWHYCEAHLYGRQIRNGQLMARVVYRVGQP